MRNTNPTDKRLFAPAVARNREPITQILADFLPEHGNILEIASGSGEHIIHFAQTFPDLHWIPSEPNAEKRQSIQAWIDHSPCQNITPPASLDLIHSDWQLPNFFSHVNVICAINLVHIAPLNVCDHLMSGAAAHLKKGGYLYLYGPYRIGKIHISEGNQQFDLSLQQQNPHWGVRDLEDILYRAHGYGLILNKVIHMPNNNYSVLFRKPT